MLDMITDMQSERIDSQRAELQPAKKPAKEAKGASLPGLRHQHTTSTKPEDDFLEMIARVQVRIFTYTTFITSLRKFIICDYRRARGWRTSDPSFRAPSPRSERRPCPMTTSSPCWCGPRPAAWKTNGPRYVSTTKFYWALYANESIKLNLFLFQIPLQDTRANKGASNAKK